MAARKILKVLAGLAGLLVCGLLALYLYISWNLPSVDILKSGEGLRGLLQVDDQPPPEVALLPLEALPPHLVNAFIAANADFPGAFKKGLAHRLLTSRQAKYGHLEGAVLQLNIALFLTPEEILEAWLATAYFGKNIFGVSAAAEKYHGKPLSELTLCEGAVLASIPKASIYNPVDYPDRAKERQQAVLEEMLRLGLIGEADRRACGR